MGSADSLAAEVAQDALNAYYARQNGDLTEALRLYRLCQGGLAHLNESEKDRVVMRFGNFQIAIKELQAEIAQATGASKVRRIPVQHVPITFGLPDCDYYR